MSETIHAGDLRLTAYRPSRPTGPPVLCIHGMFSGAWEFEGWGPFLAEHGYPVYAVDLRGRGGSRPAPDMGCVSLADYLDDSLDAARAVAGWHGVDAPLVIGHSMGGLLAQGVAEAGLALAALLLCPAPPSGIHIVSLTLAWKQLKNVGAMLRDRPIVPDAQDLSAVALQLLPPPEREAVLSRLVPESGRATRELSLSAMSVDAARVRCPVRVVTGTEDRLVPPGVAHRVALRYGASFVEYAAHAHSLLAEPGWEAIALESVHWLDRVSRGAPAEAARTSAPLSA